VIEDSISGADAPALCARAGALLQAGGGDLVVCDLAAVTAPGLGAIDALARLQLAARRGGWRLALRHVSAELGDLIALCGLEQVLVV
jgi:anti-anti-sigma regulatory factor